MSVPMNVYMPMLFLCPFIVQNLLIIDTESDKIAGWNIYWDGDNIMNETIEDGTASMPLFNDCDHDMRQMKE